MRMPVLALIGIVSAAVLIATQSGSINGRAEAASSVFGVNKEARTTELDGRHFQVVGLRTSNALISDEATNELIANMDTFKAYGINTFSVFFQGSRFGDIKGFNEDTTLNATYAARMARIIQAADDRDMVVLVGMLYYGGSDAKWSSWGQNEANQAVANAVRWLKDNNFRNVFIDVNNEHMAPFNDGQLIAAGKSVDPGFIMGTSGRETPDNADVSLHFGATNIPGKPYIESEGTPEDYWGSWSRSSSTYNYSNIGVYTDTMKNDWKQRTSSFLTSGKGYIGASTWLQSVPPLGPNHRPGGYGTSSDPGIRFWLEHVKALVSPDSPVVAPSPDVTSTPESPTGPLASSLTLIDAAKDLPIAKHDPLVEGAVIDLTEASELNIVFNPPPEGVHSVRFSVNDEYSYSIENIEPYALAGDAAGGTDFLAWTPSTGTYTVTATPYSGYNATGTAGTPVTITFTVVDGLSTDSPSTDSAAPTATSTPLPDADTGEFTIERYGEWGYLADHPSGIRSPVEMRTLDSSGQVVYRIHEENSPYCAFGNDPGQPCTKPWLAKGTYRIEATFTANDGSRATVGHSVAID